MKHTLRNAVFSIVVTVAMSIAAGPAHAAAYLKIGDIKGESADKAHRDWSDVRSFSHAIVRTGEGGRTTGAPDVKVLKVGKEIDKASPKIQESLLVGRSIPSVMLELTRSVGGEEVVYLRYELTNVIIVSYTVDMAGGAAGEPVPTEDFSLNFEEIKVTYTAPDKEVSEYSYNVAEGVAR